MGNDEAVGGVVCFCDVRNQELYVFQVLYYKLCICTTHRFQIFKDMMPINHRMPFLEMMHSELMFRIKAQKWFANYSKDDAGTVIPM